MLKHMLNTTSSAASPATDNKQYAVTVTDGLHHQTTDNMRGVPEPEYQNTRSHTIHHSRSPDFYRSVPLNKSVRSLGNVCEEANAFRVSREVADLRWNRSTLNAIDSSEVVSHASRYYRNSSLNHSFLADGVHAHPLVAQKQSSAPSPPHRLNHTVDGSGMNYHAGGTIKVIANGGLHIAKSSPVPPTSGTRSPIKTDSNAADISKYNYNVIRNAASSSVPASTSQQLIVDGVNVDVGAIAVDARGNGIKEILTSLGLLCLISLLLALLSLIFLLKISPVTAADIKDLLRAEQFTIISPDEYVTVYEVTLALCALSLSLNLCCLLVCSVQFLFTVKLARSLFSGDRTNKYLQKSAITRVCAIAGFFISIPVFLTGVILYTFIQFHSTSAIISSLLIGSGIVFCGCAMVHNVFVWQKEKTNAVKELVQRKRLNEQLSTARKRTNNVTTSTAPTRNANDCISDIAALPSPNLVSMNSAASTPHELSTLV